MTATVVPQRRCGRCQRLFDGDPTLAFQTGWALCPACDAILLPRPGQREPHGAPGAVPDPPA